MWSLMALLFKAGIKKATDMNRFILFSLLCALFLAGCSEPEKPTISLNLAIERGDINQIERHIQWRSDINRANSEGETPLHLAVSQGSYIIVKLLVNNGANINVLDKVGNSALTRAVLGGHTQITEYLITQGAEHDPTQLLHHAISAGVTDREIIPLLVKHGAQIDAQNSAGQTPLTAAISKNNRVQVKLLIQSGADVRLANGANLTPLSIAQKLGNGDIVRLLQLNGAE